MPSKRSESSDVSSRAKRLKKNVPLAGDSHPTTPDRDIYKVAVKFEEQEADSRDSDRDAELFSAACQRLKTSLQQIHRLKSSSENSASDLLEVRHDVAMGVLVLKKLNRLEKLRLAAARARTNQSRASLDSFHLTLENLLYTVLHLRKEIGRCVAFRSRDEDISLVPVDEFLCDAPENIATPGIASGDEHQLHVARLSWELEQRKQLTAACKLLMDSQHTVSRAIDTRRASLHALTPKLDTLLQSTKSLQSELGVKLDEERDQQRMSRLLSEPLYAIFLHMSSFAKTCDSSIKVSIHGDKVEADTFNSKHVNHQPSPDDDADIEEERDEEEVGKRRNRAGGSTVVDEQTRVRNTIQQHPLRVCVQISEIGQDGAVVELVFSHLLGLNLVFVTPSVLQHSNCLLSGDWLLHSLPLCDHSSADCWLQPCMSSFYTAAGYRLSSAALPALNQLIHRQLLGRPYCWLQLLARSQLLESGGGGGQRSPVPALIEAVKRRVSVRLQLDRITQSLERGNVQVCGEVAINAELWPEGGAPTARLSSWASVTHEQLLEAVSQLPAATLVQEQQFHYRAVFCREQVSLTCYISIPLDYPLHSPVFLLLLKRGDHTEDARTHPTRTVECGVNTVVPNRVEAARGADSVLSCQLRWLQYSLDILCSSDKNASTPSVSAGSSLRGAERLPALFFTADQGYVYDASCS